MCIRDRVTVCPPKSSHTALNHDLMRLHNDSLTEENRKFLNQAALDIFLKPGHLDYIDWMLQAANPEYLEDMLQGYQSVPQPFQTNSMLETFLSKPNGTYQTAGYGGELEENFYKRDKMDHYVLEFPDGLAELLGNDSLLMIELEVDTREEEGWLEEVIADGRTLKLYNEERLNFEDASAKCKSKGGFLGSILSEKEQQDLKDMLNAAFAANNDQSYNVYIGVNDKEVEDEWRWPDGSPYDYEHWNDGEPNNVNNEDCTQTNGGGWNDVPCHLSLIHI